MFRNKDPLQSIPLISYAEPSTLEKSFLWLSVNIERVHISLSIVSSVNTKHQPLAKGMEVRVDN